METTKPDNELIAEFMGYTCDNNHGWYEGPRINNEVTSAIGKGVFAFNIDSAMFHESWDWLMPVVEKIDQTIKNTHWIKGYWFVHELSITTPINELYKYVVEFIKWHNSQKL